ncbi:MAG TPA: hypothetical protein VMT12_02945 [Syntrophales bacterium]|nr:hypothetical protein [Syntrophales bacterium]
MKNLSEIIKKRSTLGILIFDLEEKLLYSNPEAMHIMSILGETAIHEGAAFRHVPEPVLGLLRKLKENSTKVGECECIEQTCVMLNGVGNPYALRAFHIGHDLENGNPTHIMIMVERAAETHEPDFDKAKLEFDLSKIEIEVYLSGVRE